MEQFLKKIPHFLIGGIVAIVIAASFNLLGTFNSSPANAASTYSYNSNGSVSVNYNGTNYVLAKQATQSGGRNDYRGSIKVNWQNGQKCMLGIQVLAAPNATNGTVGAPAFMNGLAGAGGAGQATTQSCPKDFAASQSEFNKSISIAASGGSTTGTETDGQRQAVVTLYSPTPSPPSATVTKKQAGKADSSQQITSYNVATGSVTWANIDAGTQLQFCINPVSPFDTQQCKSGTKQFGQPLLISFGSAATAYNPDGKKITVDVNMNVPAAPTGTTYGPVSLTLYKSSDTSTALGNVSTDSISFGSADQPTVKQPWTLKGIFDNVDAGQYKVCVTGNTSLCSPVFTKAANEAAETAINVSEADTAKLKSSGGASSCTIEGVGWILCPVLNFTGHIVDAAYDFVASLLQVQPLVTTGGTSGAYQAWTVMRSIANVAFVIAFLIIIFSQLTGIGVSNYGVKKLLPRLVIAAILVNISFYICSIAIDASNIIGASIRSVFTNIGTKIPAVTTSGIGSLNTDAGWTGVIGGILAATATGTVLYYAGLSALIPALLAVLVAIVTVFVVLVLRQALLILLIVVAPLAFVAYLLPNTEDLFTKWRKLLTTLLLMYPIIAGIFGASALASTIVMNGANGPYQTVIQIMGMCIAILPLALTPVVMRTAGGMLNRFGGIVNNVNKGPIDRLRKTSEKYREGRANLRNSRALAGQSQLGRGAFVRWRNRRAAIAGSRQSEVSHANTEYLADQIQKKSSFRKAMAGGTLGNPASEAAQQRALASAISTNVKLEAEEVNAASVVLKDAKLNQAEVSTIAHGGEIKLPNGISLNGGTSTAMRSAAIQSAVATNDVATMNSLWNQAKSWTGEDGGKLRTVLADSLQSSSIRPGYFSQGAIAGLRTNTHGLAEATIREAIKNNTYSAEKIAAADKDELNVIAQTLYENKGLPDDSPFKIESEAVERILANTTKALTDPRIAPRIGKNIEQIQNIKNGVAPAEDKRIWFRDPREGETGATPPSTEGVFQVNHNGDITPPTAPPAP